MTQNSLGDAEREYFFTLLMSDRRTILEPNARGKRFSGAALGRLVLKYVPVVRHSGLAFSSTCSEHSLGAMVDKLAGRQDFQPSNEKSIGYARAKLKNIHSALKVGFIDDSWVVEHLKSCNFHEAIVKNILRRKFKSSASFIAGFVNAKAHQMYV